MSKTLSLSLVMRKCSKVNEKLDGRSSSQNNIIYGIFGAIAMILIYFIGKTYAKQSIVFGTSDIVTPCICALLSIAIFMVSIVRLINQMYMSSDLSILTTLPFSAFQLAFARLISASVMSFVISFGALIPYALGYGINSKAGAFFYISVFINAIIIPIFSMTLAASIIIIFFTIFRFARNKDLFSVIGIIFTVLVLVSVIFFQNGNNISDTEQINVALKKVVEIVSRIVIVIPPVYFLGLFASTMNFIYLFIALVITALSFFIFYILSRFFYLKGALAMQNTSSSSRILTSDDLKKACKKKSVVRSYMKKEFRMLRRTPAYILNCFVMTFIWPVIFVAMMFINDDSLLKNLSMVSDHINSSSLVMTTGITIFAVAFVSAMNYIAVSSISREGKSFFYMKIMPITYKNQIKAKRNVALIVVNLGTTLYITIFLIILCSLGKLVWWAPIYGAVLSFFLTLISVDVAVMWGVKKANISWENEAYAMQSMHPLATMGIGILIAILFAGIEMFLMILNVNFLIPMIVVLLLFIGISLLINKSMFKYTRKKLNYM